jgi:hypothetical protein
MNNFRRKAINIAITLVALLVTVIMDEIYRPWAYANKIQDFGIADSSIRFFGTGVFDIKDVIAVLLGILVTYLICLAIDKGHASFAVKTCKQD